MEKWLIFPSSTLITVYVIKFNIIIFYNVTKIYILVVELKKLFDDMLFRFVSIILRYSFFAQDSYYFRI